MTREKKSFAELIEARLTEFFAMHEDRDPESGLYERVMSEVEYILIKKTIEQAGGVQVKAAKILGLNRNTLRKKVYYHKT